MNKLNLHDSNIIGIRFDNAACELVMQLIFPDDITHEIMFYGVYDFTLSPFENQNIIYDVKEYKIVPKWLADDYNISLSLPYGVNLYHIDSSCGMEGIVLATGVKSK